MSEIGVGVVGCGFVGLGAHVPAMAAIEGARLVAVADGDPARLSKASRKYSVGAAYADYAELVRDPAVRAVVVAVPTPMHVPVALAAIAAGKHVLCEMPLAARLEDVDRLGAAATKAGVCLMPGLNFRFTPSFVRAKEQLRQGAVGAVTAVHYREFIPAKDLAAQWPPGSWAWNIDQSGGPLFTLSVWAIDLLRWLLDDEIADFSAAATYGQLPQFGGTLGYDGAAALRFQGGAVGSLLYSGTAPGPAGGCALEILGSAARLLVARDHHSLSLLADDPARTEWNVGEPGARQWGHQQQDEHFIRALLEGRSPAIGVADGRRAVELAQKLARATAPERQPLSR